MAVLTLCQRLVLVNKIIAKHVKLKWILKYSIDVFIKTERFVWCTERWCLRRVAIVERLTDDLLISNKCSCDKTKTLFVFPQYARNLSLPYQTLSLQFIAYKMFIVNCIHCFGVVGRAWRKLTYVHLLRTMRFSFGASEVLGRRTIVYNIGLKWRLDWFERVWWKSAIMYIIGWKSELVGIYIIGWQFVVYRFG